MELLEAVYQRRAVRDYSPESPEPEVITAVIEAAIQAPTAMHREPWRFTVVCDRMLLRNWSDAAKAHVLGTITPGSPLQRLAGELASPTFNIFYNAPMLIVISSTVAEPMAEQDCCLAAENLMLAAVEKGLGTCWIGFAEMWLRLPQGKQALGVPQEQVPVAPLIIGYPKSKPPAPGRRDPEIRWIR